VASITLSLGPLLAAPIFRPPIFGLAEGTVLVDVGRAWPCFPGLVLAFLTGRAGSFARLFSGSSWTPDAPHNSQKGSSNSGLRNRKTDFNLRLFKDNLDLEPLSPLGPPSLPLPHFHQRHMFWEADSLPFPRLLPSSFPTSRAVGRSSVPWRIRRFPAHLGLHLTHL